MCISNTYDVLKDVWFSISCQRKSISYCSIDRLDGDIWFRYISLDIPTLHPHTTLKISLDKTKHLKMRDLPFRMNTFYLPFLFFFFFLHTCITLWRITYLKPLSCTCFIHMLILSCACHIGDLAKARTQKGVAAYLGL